jgi:hypothetical protein
VKSLLTGEIENASIVNPLIRPDGATLGPQKFSSNIAASKKQEKIDVERMHTVEPPIPAKDVDEGEGKTEVN